MQRSREQWTRSAARIFRWTIVLTLSTPLAFAMHEVDHRFVVEGFVCGTEGRAASDVQVMVKDTRISDGATSYTDSRGFYKVVLHLHNDNQGDPILVTAGDREQRLTAKFDPKDVHTERKVTVNFGGGCETAEGSTRWVYYGAGVGLAAVAAFAGVKLIRKRRRPVKRGKASR